MKEKVINRLFKYLDYKSIPHTRFEKEIGLSNGYLKIQLRRSADIGEGVLNKIIDNCLDINLSWLLTGHGEMLRPTEGKTQTLTPSTAAYSKTSEKNPAALDESAPRYGKAKENKPVISSDLDEKERMIQELKDRLNDKDRQIKDLKTNFERLITSKDELLAMKDHTLKIYLENIKKQSARLSELEAYKETQEAKKISTYEAMPDTGMPSEKPSSPDDVTRDMPRPYGRAGKRPPA